MVFCAKTDVAHQIAQSTQRTGMIEARNTAELTPQVCSSKLNKNMLLDWLGSKVGTISDTASAELCSGAFSGVQPDTLIESRS